MITDSGIVIFYKFISPANKLELIDVILLGNFTEMRVGITQNAPNPR